MREFPQRDSPLNPILQAWNQLELAAAAAEVLPCCSAQQWARGLALARPLDDEQSLLATSDKIWLALGRADWDEAFASHPRIGEKKIPAVASRESAEWSHQEQGSVANADNETREQLQRGNTAYEERFGSTYIVCATGKTAEEMLTILLRRLHNTEEQELLEAVEQQRQITQLRLRKWLQP